MIQYEEEPDLHCQGCGFLLFESGRSPNGWKHLPSWRLPTYSREQTLKVSLCSIALPIRPSIYIRVREEYYNPRTQAKDFGIWFPDNTFRLIIGRRNTQTEIRSWLKLHPEFDLGFESVQWL